MQTALAWLVYSLLLVGAAWLFGSLALIAVLIVAGLLPHWFGYPELLWVTVMCTALRLWAEQYRPYPRVMVSIGQDWQRDRDCCVYIGWQLQPEIGLAYQRYARSIEMTWDWLPLFFYRHVYDMSRNWTGRHRELIAWSWWGLLTVRTPDGRRFWHAR